MKVFFLFTIISFLSVVSKGQSAQEKEVVKKVVIAFQEDFNDGGFKNAAAYTTTAFHFKSMVTFRNHFKTAWRSIWKNKTTTVEDKCLVE